MDNQRAENLGNYAEDYQDAEVFEEMEDDLDDDESIEAFGEDDLDDDESFYAEYDDDDESIEAFGEDDLDDDESFYAEYDDDDESFEYDDDDESFDEDYEDLGEADEDVTAEISRRARRRRWRRKQIAKMRAKQRARLLQKRAKAARLKAARNARIARRKLANKLKVIRTRRPVVFTKITKPLGTGYIRATLRNGRSADMKITPPIAMRTDVRRLARQIRSNGIKWNKAIRVQGKNIKLLKSAQSSAVKSLTAQQLKSSKLLTKQITDGDKNLDKRITKLVNSQKKSGRRQDRKMLSKVQQQQKRSTWNTALVAGAIPLFSAYGDRAAGDGASPFTEKNMIIAGSTAAFLFADDLLVRYMTGSGKKWRTGLNVWNVAAPFLNWAVVYLLMRNKQHQRFVTGITKVEGTGESNPIPIPVGKGHKFETFDNPPVVAGLIKASNNVHGVKARVESGKLYLTLTGDSLAAASNADVAWQVDTIDPKYKRTASASSA